jgi:hypothetical protein
MFSRIPFPAAVDTAEVNKKLMLEAQFFLFIVPQIEIPVLFLFSFLCLVVFGCTWAFS